MQVKTRGSTKHSRRWCKSQGHGGLCWSVDRPVYPCGTHTITTVTKKTTTTIKTDNDDNDKTKTDNEITTKTQAKTKTRNWSGT